MVTYVRQASNISGVYRVNSDGSYTKLSHDAGKKIAKTHTIGVDPRAGLTGADRDIFNVINGIMSQYGLKTLGPRIAEFIRQGYSADTINVLLQETPEYKQRFAANDARTKKGLPALSPAEYLAVEQSYRQIMSSAGLPIGFYDQPSDFTKWIEGDVSPQEIQTRVKAAEDLVTSADPRLRAQFSQWYTKGDLVAYALDRKRAADVVAKQVAAAGVGSAAQAQGVKALDRAEAERLAEMGVDYQSAVQGMGQVRDLGQRGHALGDVYGIGYNEQTALNDVFFSDEAATEKRRKIASNEQAAFSGSSGTSSNSLSTRRAGQI
jgi:hypothetical protein